MKNRVASFLFTLLALGLAGCAVTPVVHAWKVPASGAALASRIAVVVVEDRFVIREGVENRFVRELGQQGQDAIPTHDLLSLQEIKSNAQQAEARFGQEGAQAVMIIRVRMSEAVPAEGPDPVPPGAGWFDCFSAAFSETEPLRGMTRQKCYFEVSLHELDAATCQWSAHAAVTLKDDAAKLPAAERVARKLAAGLWRDRLIR